MSPTGIIHSGPKSGPGLTPGRYFTRRSPAPNFKFWANAQFFFRFISPDRILGKFAEAISIIKIPPPLAFICETWMGFARFATPRKAPQRQGNMLDLGPENPPGCPKHPPPSPGGNPSRKKLGEEGAFYKYSNLARFDSRRATRMAAQSQENSFCVFCDPESQSRWRPHPVRFIYGFHVRPP